jgi:hypothetical protein
MAQSRVCTIAIGIFMCLAVCVLVCPVWAGQELHRLTARNMDKLAGAVEACVKDYFADQPADGKQPPSDKAEGYKCVLNSKASEDSQANLARWEPAHGRFGFRHPYEQYKSVGAAMRHCAYCVEALSGCARSEIQAPDHVKRRLAGGCASVAARCALVLREASSSVAAMKTSWALDLAVAEMNTAVQELQSDLRSLPSKLVEEESPAAVLDAVQLFTVTSLLIEVSTRIESVVDAVDTLASLAGFRSSDVEKDEASETETKVKQPAASDPDSDEPEKKHIEQV